MRTHFYFYCNIWHVPLSHEKNKSYRCTQALIWLEICDCLPGHVKKSSWALVYCMRYYVVHNFSAQMHACTEYHETMRTIYRHFTNKPDGQSLNVVLSPPWRSLPSQVRVFSLDPYPVAAPLCSPRQWSDGLSEGLSSLPSPSDAMSEYLMCFHYSKCYCWKSLCWYEMASVKFSGLWKGIVDSSPSLEDDRQLSWGPSCPAITLQNLPAFFSEWVLPYAIWVDFFLVQTHLFHAAMSYNISMSEIGLAHPGTWSGSCSASIWSIYTLRWDWRQAVPGPGPYKCWGTGEDQATILDFVYCLRPHQSGEQSELWAPQFQLVSQQVLLSFPSRFATS